jgi:hypothetical protein
MTPTDNDTEKAYRDRFENTVVHVRSTEACRREGLSCPVPVPTECTKYDGEHGDRVFETWTIVDRLWVVMYGREREWKHGVWD